MTKTNIEWTDVSWNPVRGCSRISPGCGGGTPGGGGGCYAERQAIRHAGVGGHYEGLAMSTISGPRWTGVVREVPRALAAPLGWKTPRMCFVNSMSDLFHESVSNEFIASVYAVMGAVPTSTFQVLTKRAGRMVDWFRWLKAQSLRRREPEHVVCLRMLEKEIGGAVFDVAWSRSAQSGLIQDEAAWPLRNVWQGVSVENRRHGLPRVELLRGVPAALRFLSVEPLLESLGELDLTGIGWVIVGGESGPGARPFNLAWADAIIRRCRAAHVKVFCKQLGAVPVMDQAAWELLSPLPGLRLANRCRAPNGTVPLGLTDKKGGNPEEWPEDLRVREMPLLPSHPRHTQS